MNVNERDRSRELDERLDRALDALAAEQAPDMRTLEDPEYLDLIDMARVARALRAPAFPDESFAARIAEQIAGSARSNANIVWAENGHHQIVPARTVHLPQRRSARMLVLLAALLRALGSGALAGMLVGVLVGGAGARLVMYISGQMYLREHPGSVIVTESSGQPVGTFSWSGTIDLLIEGMFSGALGGLLYVAVRRWLPGSARWHGAIFGLFLLLAAGSMTISSGNEDFARIGSAWLNVAMFALIFVLFGVFLVPLVARLDRWFAPRGSPATRAALRRAIESVIILPLGAFGALIVTGLVLGVLVAAVATIVSVLLGEVSVLNLLGVATAVLVIVVLPVASLLASPAAASFTDRLPVPRAHRADVRGAMLERVARNAFMIALASGLMLVLYNVYGILTGG